MPHPHPPILPPDFASFMLPPAALGDTNHRLSATQSLDLGLSAHAGARQALDSLAQAPGQPGAPGRAGPRSPVDDLMNGMEDLDLGVSGHGWARQELDSLDSSHAAQGGGPTDPAAQLYPLTPWHLLQQALGRQVAPGAARIANDAAVAEAVAVSTAMLELDDCDALDAADVPAMAFLRDAMHAPTTPETLMAPNTPITSEEIFLEEATAGAFTPMTGCPGSMDLAGLTGLHPGEASSGL